MAKKNEYARITVDLPMELHRRLKSVTALNGVSMRQFIIIYLEKALDKLKK